MGRQVCFALATLFLLGISNGLELSVRGQHENHQGRKIGLIKKFISSFSSKKGDDSSGDDSGGVEPVEAGGGGDCFFYAVNYIKNHRKRDLSGATTIRHAVTEYVKSNCASLIRDTVELELWTALHDDMLHKLSSSDQEKFAGINKNSPSSSDKTWMCKKWASVMDKKGFYGDAIAIRAFAASEEAEVVIYREKKPGVYDVVNRRGAGGGKTFHVLNIDNAHFQAFDAEPKLDARAGERDQENDYAENLKQANFKRCKEEVENDGRSCPGIKGLDYTTFEWQYGTVCDLVKQNLCHWKKSKGGDSSSSDGDESVE